MTTEFELTLADNGYILSTPQDELLLVYEGEAIPEGISESMLRELMCDLEEAIDNGEYGKFKITVSVEPIKDE